MNLLDMRTLVLSNVITNIVCVWFAVMLWRQSRDRFNGTAFWVLDFVFQTVALVLIILRGAIPDWMSMVLSNTLVITGAILGLLGLERFFGKKSGQIYNYLLLTLFIFIHGYFTLVQPNLAIRNLNLSVVLLLVCFQCLWLMWHRVKPGQRSLTFGVGMVFFLYCLVSSVRIVHFFITPHVDNNYFQPALFEALVLVSYQVLFILLTYSLVLMVNKRLLMAIATQEEKFSKAFHSAPYAITITNPSDGTIIDVNETFTSFTGLDRTEVMGKKTIDLHLWEHDEDRAAVVDALLKTGKVHGKEMSFQGKNGETITGFFSAEIITIDGEKNILSSIGDITERKRMEEALKESEEKFRLLAASAHDAIISMDHEGNVFFWNDAAEKMFGYANQEVMGKNCHKLIVPVRYHEAYEKGFDIFRNSGHGAAIGNTLELEARKKDGMEFPVELSLSSIRFHGEWSAVGIIRDISERKRMEKELQDSENRYHELSIVDDLTQLFNSRHFYFQLKRELDRSSRYGQPLTLLLLDLDDFKAYNDTYGHVEGDQVLRRLGQVVKRCLRETDSAYRYGGEEFTILLPMTTSMDGTVTAERIRTEFKKEIFIPVSGEEVHMTFSIGLAQYKPPEEMKAFVHRVDQLMYKGKKDGKDRVCCE